MLKKPLHCASRFYRVLNSSSSSTTMEPVSKLTRIGSTPKEPVKLFSDLVEANKQQNPDRALVTLNLATVDSEFGVLNRTLVYRGLTDGHVTFVTEKNSRKYLNIKTNPKVSVTFTFGKIVDPDGGEGYWQVRQFAEAVELAPQQISALWDNEPEFAKIRSHICQCGRPIEQADLQKAHDDLLKRYENGETLLPETETYTAFKVIPTIWDFYKSEAKSIADRVQYRKEKTEGGDTWKILRVAP